MGVPERRWLVWKMRVEFFVAVSAKKQFQKILNSELVWS